MGCHIPLSPSLCILGDISIINSNDTDGKLTPSGSNYRQENYPHELEIKEYHTYYILEKLNNRLHLHGKPVNFHSK